MKKVFAAVLVFALLLPVLAGCQSALAKQYTTTPAPQKQEITPKTGEIPVVPQSQPALIPETKPVLPLDTAPEGITRQKAIEIALNHATLTKEQVRDLDAEWDKERGVPLFEVDFESGAYEYEYEIHAETGAILRAEKERD